MSIQDYKLIINLVHSSAFMVCNLIDIIKTYLLQFLISSIIFHSEQWMMQLHYSYLKDKLVESNNIFQVMMMKAIGMHLQSLPVLKRN